MDVEKNKTAKADPTTEEFAARLSHQLKTPVAIAEGFCRIAMQQLRDRGNEHDGAGAQKADRAVEWLDRCIETLQSLSQTVEDVSAGIVSGDYVRAPLSNVHDLRVLLHEAVEEHRLLPNIPSARFNIVGDSAIVNCDRARIKQAFSNILNRCAKSSHRGDFDIEISTSQREALISFADYCPIIDQKQLELVFSNRAKYDSPNDASKDSIVGLTLSQSIILAHGGVMTISPTVRMGNKIVIRLPYIKI